MPPLSLSDEPVVTDWLPRTKLAPNVLDTNSLVRHRVLKVLHNAICDSRLTLLSAPAGYGKSTLLNLWLQAIFSLGSANDGMQAAYLSLDTAENDRTHFLLALIAALQTMHPNCGRRAQAFLTQNGYPEFVDAATQTQILTGLIVIDIAQYLPQRFVLILDNYEEISEPTVHSALNYLLRRLPPQAHLVISTRHEPPLSLAKMRAYGLATVLRAETLAFDEVESAAFLEKVANLPLASAEKLLLHRHTEGWPAGLCLLAQDLHALPHEVARIQFIASLENGQEPPLICPTVEDYLREELFDDLPRSMKTFLMQTSILSTLRVEVCQAVTGYQNTSEIVETLCRRNLFLFRHTAQGSDGDINSIHSRPIFRYHTLFAAFLRQRLYQEMPEQIIPLHRRAAEAEVEPVEKIRHYLTAQCWTEAGSLLSNMSNGSDWPHETLAKLLRNTNHLPAPLRQIVAARRKVVLPPAATKLGLTARQFEVLALLEHGASNQVIASELFITLATVKEHIGEIMRKLKVRTRSEAVRRAIELGLLSR